MSSILAPRRDNHGRFFAEQHGPSQAHTPESRHSTVPNVPTASRTTTSSSTATRLVAYDWQEPHLVKTPWELNRHRQAQRSSWRRSKVVQYQFPAKVFKNLPKDVYECIVAQLEEINLRQKEPCSSCYLRDLHSLSLVSRAFDKAARSQMYRRILLLSNEEHPKWPRLKTKGTSRLKLLRRTLRDQPTLARCVRELHLSDFQTLYPDAGIGKEEIVNLVASLVMACPRLERLVGFHIPFTHSFDRLTHALSTRSYMKERLWSLSDQVIDFSDEEDNDLGRFYLAEFDTAERFLELNANQPGVSTLVLHQDQHKSQRQNSMLNFRAIVGTFRQFPFLRHLTISGLPAGSFTNMTLSALPLQLHSLRLENLSGINDKGLQRFATSPLAINLQSLVLIDLDISSLDTIAGILSDHFMSLKDFSFAQQHSPRRSSQNPALEFSSRTIEFIHFEIRADAGPLPTLSPPTPDASESPSFPFTSQEPITCLATLLLAEGIKNGAFPSLRRVRVPHDPQGFIQALCKPVASALHPSDMHTLKRSLRTSGSSGAWITADYELDPNKARHSSDRADSAIEVFSHDLSQRVLTPARSRLAAQARILAARKKPLATLRVYDCDSELKVDTVFGGFIGSVSSQITYDLKTDRGRMLGGVIDDTDERNQWIVNIEDVLGEAESDQIQSLGRVWTNCGHRHGNRVGRNLVMVKDLM